MSLRDVLYTASLARVIRKENASLRAERGQLCEACGTAEAEIHDEAGSWCEPCENARCAEDARAAGLPESFCRRLERRP